MRELASLLALISLIHGVSLGAMLMYFSSKRKPSFLLGVFLFLFGLSFLFNALSDYGIVIKNPILFLMPFRFCFLVFPILYLYVKGLTRGIKAKKEWHHLIPGFLEFLSFCFLLVYIPNDQKKDFYFNNGFLYTSAANIYTAYYLIKTIRLINRHRKNVHEFYSDIENKLLSWLKPIILSFLSLIILDHLLLGAQFIALDLKEIRKPLLAIYVAQNAIYTLFTYWIAFYGLKQHSIQTKADKESKISIKTNNPKPINQEEFKELFTKIQEYLSSTKCYTNEELTIVDLANALDLHYRKASRVINQQANCTFNNFINQFRVEEAKRIMNDPERIGKLTLEVVGQEVGFKSNSSLYTAFRRFEGKTPSTFMKTEDS